MERSGNTLKCFTMMARATSASVFGVLGAASAAESVCQVECRRQAGTAITMKLQTHLLHYCNHLHAHVDSVTFQLLLSHMCRAHLSPSLAAPYYRTSHSDHRLWAPEPLEDLAILAPPLLPGPEQKILLCCDVQGVSHKPAGWRARNVAQLPSCGGEEAVYHNLSMVVMVLMVLGVRRGEERQVCRVVHCCCHDNVHYLVLHKFSKQLHCLWQAL